MKRVGFIIGGVQKSGTGTLYHYLSQHPGLAPSRPKETHFFDNEAVDWSRPDYTRYHAHWARAAEERLWFEATPIYIFWPHSLARIKAYRADMPLIFVFRDPIERAFSHWCMTYAKRNDPMEFGAAIRQGRDRLSVAPPLSKAHRHLTYVERGSYGGQVECLLALFPRENMLFLKFDDLTGSPEAVLQRVTTFLRVAPLATIRQAQLNPRAPVSYPSSLTREDVSLLRSIYREDLRRFADLTGLDVSQWLTFQDQ